MKRAKIAVIGASGYTGLELLRLLLTHPHAELVCVTSRQNAGRSIGELFPRFSGAESAGLKFIAPDADAVAATGADVAFLALPHGVAAGYASSLIDKGLRIVDLSADFRLDDTEVYKEFYDNDHPAPELLKEAVYGLPEVRREEIVGSRLVAAPGCYPTSIILPLIPLLREKLIDPSNIVTCSMSGVSGAGRKADLSLLFCECNESLARLRGEKCSYHSHHTSCRFTMASAPPRVPSSLVILTRFKQPLKRPMATNTLSVC